MNKFIKAELNKCTIDLPPYNEQTTQIFIPRKTVDFSNDKYYNIIVEDYIIHPYDGFTLHQNWNNNNVPTDKEMNCKIVQDIGKMIKIDAVGVTDGLPWTGWLPKKSCKIIKEI